MTGMLIIAGCIFAATTVVIFTCMTLYDARMIRLDRRYRSKHFRHQPYVSVVVNDDVSDASLKSIRQSNYHKHEIIFAGEPVQNDIVMELGRDAALEPTAMRRAILRLQHMPSCGFVEIKPMIPKPTTPQQLFNLYHTVALAPFISVRAQMNIQPSSYSSWPVVRKLSVRTHPWRLRIYTVICWIFALANAIILTYLIYIAVWLNQPELLFIYIAAFGLWVIVGLWDYRSFSLRQKFIHTFLIPASLGYFLLVAIYAPIALPLQVASKVTAKLFSRSVHQPVVETRHS